MTVALIWAQAANGVIGHRGSLPWHLPEDLALFRRLTTGGTVLMGRRTWESLPDRFRPLPRRRNLVLTSRRDWEPAGAEAVRSVEQAISAVLPTVAEPLWVIGGAAVYAAALPQAERAVVTEIDHDFSGDRWAPALTAEWRLTASTPEAGWAESSSGLRYRVRAWERPPVAATPGVGGSVAGRTSA